MGVTQSLLDGLRVVEVSAFVAAPIGAMTLAQLGAEVIRIDPIGGGADIRRAQQQREQIEIADEPDQGRPNVR